MGVEEQAEGIGSTRRRRKAPVTDVKPERSPTAEDALHATRTSGPDSDDKGVDGVGPECAFDLAYIDVRGYEWKGRFKNHILTIREKVEVGLTRSRLSAGLPPDALDQTTVQILEMQAHLAVSLDEAPQWALDLGKVRDLGVMAAIYKEVASHEARFWGADGEDAGEVDAR